MKYRTGIIILAAGSSSRMGRPKQLLPYKGKSLLRHVIDEATANSAHGTTVVLGAHNGTIIDELKIPTVQYCINPDWETGMASSIQKGLKTLLGQSPDMENCIITVCDQPYIDKEVFEGLKTMQKTAEKGIIAAEYAQTWGVPVLFTKPYFKDLLQLDGQQGARKIIREHLEDMALFPFEQGKIDIDTLTDYRRLID